MFPNFWLVVYLILYVNIVSDCLYIFTIIYTKCTYRFLSFADMRGFMTSHGQPDQSRSARYILKDYVSVSHMKWRVRNYRVLIERELKIF